MNAIEPVGVVVELDLAHVPTPLHSLVVQTVAPLDPRERLSCAA